MAETIILSPHCDDVPLSLGAALLARTFGSLPLVAVVFSVSCFTKDEPCTGRVEAVTALRESEELCASRQASYQTRFLGFPEPFVRPGFVSFNDIFDKRRNEEDDAIFSVVSKAIDDLIASQDGLTVAPLGCGNHIDHRIVHRSVLASFKVRKGIQVGFYEDLPYSAFLPESEILARIPRFPGVSFYPVVVNRGFQEKIAMLQVYESQLRKEEFEALRKHWERLGGERIWLPTRG